MSLDGFLTFIGLAVAVYAIVGPVTRLRLRMRLGTQIVAAAIAMALVLYFEFFSLLAVPCPVALAQLCPWVSVGEQAAVTPQMAAFIVVLLWMGAALSIATLAPPGAGSMRTMDRVVSALAYERRYAEILDFVRPHLALIEQAALRRLPSQRFRDWVGTERREPHVADAGQRRRAGLRAKVVATVSGIGRDITSPVLKMVRVRSADAASADTIARALYASPPMVEFIAMQRPSFAPELLGRALPLRFDFSDRLLERLMKDRGSALYEQLQDNQNLNRKNGYVIQERNFLLHAYFADAKVANELGAYKPVGDHVLRLHGPAMSDDYRSFMVGNANDFDEERWGDLTHTAIRFFDVMVRAAVEQSIRSHMWLYYMSNFVDVLERNFDPSRLVPHPYTEFPSRSARLIYECLSALRNWIKMIEVVTVDSPHASVPGNSNVGTEAIPAAAATTMGDCIYRIAMSDRLTGEFRLSMFEMVLRTITQLQGAGPAAGLRRYLIGSILTGGRNGPGLAYAGKLKALFAGIDPNLRMDVADFRSAFLSEYKTPLIG